MSVILLGTGTPLPNRNRACASTLVIAGDKTFLIDTGRGFLNNFACAGLINVNAVLFTHYHSDHFGEFGEFMVTRTIWGASEPMPVIGPVGARQTIGNMLKAYELDNEYRTEHHGDKWHENGMKAEIKEAQPGLVYDKDGVKITMFEVDHPPVKPAVGYRFDCNNQSAVISGDTRKALVISEFARDADILVHEVANKTFTEIAQRNLDTRLEAMSKEMLAYHTLTLEVAEIAQAARVKKLVLTHFIPWIHANPVVKAFYIKGMRKIFRGTIIVGKDGMEIKA
nr:MBL fold metallo-hydrolase [Candidatus Sigynarchaeota archaeon]